MRKKREAETSDRRRERLEALARAQLEQASAEANALDAAVRQSIKLYGP